MRKKLAASPPPVPRSTINPAAFPTRPVEYARQVLGIQHIWPAMEEIARAVLEPPFRVMVKSGHSVGKTFLAAWIMNWFYDSFPSSIAISTAPTKRDVCDLLWKEIRLQRARAGLPSHFLGPSVPEMRSSWDHYAKGFTASKGESFQGRHDAKMLFVMDEACGVDRNYWITTKTMWKPELGHIWLAILNPTNTTTQAYLEDQGGGWRTFSLSCLDHPNIRAELKREKPLIPAAVSLSQVNGWLVDWCAPITEAEKEATDVEWPPHSGQWFRPGAEFEARCLGRWPSQGTYGVWSDALWHACTLKDGKPRVHTVPLDELPQIGCDVARFGDDNTAIHVRWGDTSLHHEEANGWKITQTVGRLTELARQFADYVNALRREQGRQQMIKAEDIPIKVDDEGGDLGAGVTDFLGERGFNVMGVSSSRASTWPDRYPNKRSELWFSTASRAKQGMLALGRLDKETLYTLKSQAMAPEWELDSAGRRVVEPKDKTKGKIGRSPDSMDAMNLAYYECVRWEAPVVLPAPEPRPRMFSEQWLQERERKGRRKLFGR